MEQICRYVPNLRFPQYTSEWRKNRLETLVSMSKGYGITKDQLTIEGQPCILYGELYTTYKNEVVTEVKSKTDIDTKGLVYSQKNDVIIPSSGETPEDIATACCVMLDNILLGGDLNILRPYNDNGCFLSYQLNGKRKYDIARVAQGASIVHLHNEHLRSLNIFTPESLDEQEKIVSLLALIDERIDTQNKIIKEIDTLKKSICNKLFGNLNWEKYRVGDIGTLGRGRVISTSEINSSVNPKYPVYSSQTSNSGVMGYIDTYEFDGEYITWTTDGANAGTVFYRNGKFNCTNVCGTIKLNNTVDAYFVAYALQQAAKKYVSTNLANPKLMNNVMADICIYCPDLATQKRISSLVRLLDEKIAIEEQILNGYKESKHYLLSNLFI